MRIARKMSLRSSWQGFLLGVALWGAAPVAHAAAAVTRFVVAEDPLVVDPCLRCDSYVLPISDPLQIARAREIVAGARGAVIPAAEIAAGADGINRDVLAPGQPLWSWHVTRLLNFIAGGTPEELEGWPGAVELDVEGWIAGHPYGENGAGTIAFQHYTVVAELPEPGSAGPLAAIGAVSLRAWRARRAAGPGAAGKRPLDRRLAAA